MPIPKKQITSSNLRGSYKGKSSYEVDTSNLHTSILTRWVPLDSVKQWADNPKSEEEMQAKAIEIMSSIDQYGCRSPLIVWKDNSVIYKGNTTHRAMRLLNWTHVPVSYHNFKDESSAIAYALMDNNIEGKWDNKLLNKVIHSEALKPFTPDQLKKMTGFKELTFSETLEKKTSKQPIPRTNDFANFVCPLTIEAHKELFEIIREIKEKSEYITTSDILLAMANYFVESLRVA